MRDAGCCGGCWERRWERWDGGRWEVGERCGWERWEVGGVDWIGEVG